MRILLVEDHALVRAGIRRLLEDIPGVTSVAEASDGREATQVVSRHNPDIVVADISLPGLDGIQLTAWLRRHLPRCRVIIVTVHRSKDYVNEALKAGAKGYLLKDSAVEELLLALQSVRGGDVYLSPKVAQLWIPQSTAGQPTLTARQREVLALVALGRTTAEIAEALRISRRTVDSHRAQLLRRLGARDTVHLLREAARRRLIKLDGDS